MGMYFLVKSHSAVCQKVVAGVAALVQWVKNLTAVAQVAVEVQV